MTAANVRSIKRRPAKHAKPRTVTVTVEGGDYDGWSATARADFPARVLLQLESGKLTETLSALSSIIIEHNFPGPDGELAETPLDADPYQGLLEVSNLILDAIGKLPNR